MILLLLACQQPDFSQEWELDRLRLLGVRADPAEPRPGDVVTFSSLAYVPEGAEWSALWIACLVGSDQGCSIDPALLERLEQIDTMTDQELVQLVADLQAAGLIGIQPGFDPIWPIPADAMDGLTEAQQQEGLTATIQVSLATKADQELVLKSIPVSMAATPNQNPDVLGMMVGDVPAVIGREIPVVGGRPLLLVANATAPESYQYITTEGEVEERTESFSWRWYMDGGDLADTTELEPELESTAGSRSWLYWYPPKKAGVYRVDTVVLDGRGGMDWWSVNFRVE